MRLEFVAEIKSRRYLDGRSRKWRETYYITIPSAVRELLKPGTKVKVALEVIG